MPIDRPVSNLGRDVSFDGMGCCLVSTNHDGKGDKGTNAPPRGESPQGISAEDRAAFEQRVAQIGDKLNVAKGRRPSPQPSTIDKGADNGAAMGRALRISTELIGGIVVGGAIGWALDRWLGNEKPWFFIVFFMLGAAAGILNVVRAAAKEKTPPAPSVPDDEEDR